MHRLLSVLHTDLSFCGNSVTLQAVPPTNAIGTWSVVGNGMGISFDNVQSPTATVSGLTGATTLRWTIGAVNGCPTASDDVVVAPGPAPSAANAGADVVSCTAAATLGATAADNQGTGTWSVTGGPQGSFSDANSASSTFTSSTLGTASTLQWEVTKQGCATSSDTMSVVSYPVTANAGADKAVCATDAAPAMTAEAAPAWASGAWSVMAGTAT